MLMKEIATRLPAWTVMGETVMIFSSPAEEPDQLPEGAAAPVRRLHGRAGQRREPEYLRAEKEITHIA